MPLILALTALVVDQVTMAFPPDSVAVMVAVGAGTETVTVAVRVTVAPSALVATRVNVVVAVTGMVWVPLSGTEVPLMVALTALVVDQVTTALLPDSVAVIVAVGAAARRSYVASAEAGPRFAEAS